MRGAEQVLTSADMRQLRQRQAMCPAKGHPEDQWKARSSHKVADEALEKYLLHLWFYREITFYLEGREDVVGTGDSPGLAGATGKENLLPSGSEVGRR